MSYENYVPFVQIERTTEEEEGTNDTVAIRLETPLIIGRLSYTEFGEIRWEIYGLNHSETGINKESGILVVEREVRARMRNYVAGILNSLQ